MFQFLLAARSKWRCSPIVKLSHSKKDQLDFWGHTISPIQGNWGPLGTLRRVLGGPENGLNMPQIIRNSILHHLRQQHPVWWNHPIVKYFISTYYGTLGLLLGTLGDPRGPWTGPLRARKWPKHVLISSDIPFSTFNASNTQLSYSEILP